MKKVWIIITALCVLGVASPAFAKGKKGSKGGKGENPIAKYDTNGNGRIDDEEKAAVQSAFSTDSSLKRFDTNGDGKLDDSEISAMQAPAKKAGKKKK